MIGHLYNEDTAVIKWNSYVSIGISIGVFCNMYM